MDLNTITIADFKTLFARDFPYLPIWDEEKIYNAGAIIYYSANELFYKARVNGIDAGTSPTNATFWELYPDDIYNYVLDADITKAFAEAQVNLNQSLFSSNAIIQLAYLYLTAHYLCLDIRGANQGLESTGTFNVSSRSVGSVSESYAIPKEYTDNPILEYFTKTNYGLKFLSIIMPAMVGNVGVVAGGTRP